MPAKVRLRDVLFNSAHLIFQQEKCLCAGEKAAASEPRSGEGASGCSSSNKKTTAVI